MHGTILPSTKGNGQEAGAVEKTEASNDDEGMGHVIADGSKHADRGFHADKSRSSNTDFAKIERIDTTDREHVDDNSKVTHADNTREEESNLQTENHTKSGTQRKGSRHAS